MLRNIWPLLAAVAALPSVAAQPLDYPTKPLRMLTAEPGGGSDVAARVIAPGLAAGLGQPVVVDNRGGGMIIAEITARAPADGYTLLTYSSSLWLIPLMRAHTPYDPLRDYAPVTLIGKSPMVLVTHPSVAATTVKELIALAKARPGELNFASGPSGAVPHLSAELFKFMADINIVHVPFKGVGAAVVDLIGGRTQMMMPNASAALPHIKSGRLRGLAVTSAQPSALAPGLPTLAASGLPGYESVAMYAVFTPAKTPAAIVQRLNREIVAHLHRSEVKEKFLNMSTDITAGTPQALADTMRAEMARMGKVIKAARIRVD